MRSVKICLILLLVSVVINWARSGEEFHITHVLPFMGGDPVGIYDFGCLGLLVLLVSGLRRLKRNQQRRREQIRKHQEELMRIVDRHGGFQR